MVLGRFGGDKEKELHSFLTSYTRLDSSWNEENIKKNETRKILKENMQKAKIICFVIWTSEDLFNYSPKH